MKEDFFRKLGLYRKIVLSYKVSQSVFLSELEKWLDKDYGYFALEAIESLWNPKQYKGSVLGNTFTILKRQQLNYKFYFIMKFTGEVEEKRDVVEINMEVSPEPVGLYLRFILLSIFALVLIFAIRIEYILFFILLYTFIFLFYYYRILSLMQKQIIELETEMPKALGLIKK